MKLTHLMKLTVRVEAPVPIGKVLTGVRVIYNASGGEFEGNRLRGQVLPGGLPHLVRQQVIAVDRGPAQGGAQQTSHRGLAAAAGPNQRHAAEAVGHRGHPSATAVPARKVRSTSSSRRSPTNSST